MVEGWNIKTRRANPDGGSDLYGRVLVRVADAPTAVALFQSMMPNAVVLIDSEASAQAVDEYDLSPGDVLVLVEGK